MKFRRYRASNKGPKVSLASLTDHTDFIMNSVVLQPLIMDASRRLFSTCYCSKHKRQNLLGNHVTYYLLFVTVFFRSSYFSSVMVTDDDIFLLGLFPSMYVRSSFDRCLFCVRFRFGACLLVVSLLGLTFVLFIF